MHKQLIQATLSPPTRPGNKATLSPLHLCVSPHISIYLTRAHILPPPAYLSLSPSVYLSPSPNRMDKMRALMASVRDLVWEASSCQVGGSLGFTARLLADVNRLLEHLITLWPAYREGERGSRDGGREEGRESGRKGEREGRKGSLVVHFTLLMEVDSSK